MAGGGATRHAVNISKGGTTHTANQSALLPAVMDMPDHAAAAEAVRRTPIQAATKLRRLSELSIRSTLFVVASCNPAVRSPLERDHGAKS